MRAMCARRGFSLVVTLGLMLLLLLVAVGLLSLSSITLRAAGADRDLLVARANARMALILAISDLQKYAGPDQRITAHAELLVPPQPTGPMPGALPNPNMKWVGVWSTTQGANGGSPSAGNPADPSKPAVKGGANPAFPDTKFLSDVRSVPGYTPQSWMQAWLVSGNPDPTKLPVSEAKYVTMVEKAAGLADEKAVDPKNDRVTVPLVEINPTNHQKGAYAYWVGDESLKARVDLTPTDNQPNLANPLDGGMARLAGTEGPNLRKVKADADTPYGPVQDLPAADRAKLLSMNALGIPLKNSDTWKRNFHDVTSYSESVLADAREGGLKKDLTCYIGKTGNSGISPISGIPETGLPEVGGYMGRPMLPGDLYGAYAPNFLQLRNWYQLRQRISGTLGTDSMDPVYLPTRAPIGTNYGPMPDIKVCAQAVHPYVTDFNVTYDFSIDTARAGGRAVRLHVYPRVTLWNPYNVNLRPAKYWVGCLKVVQGMAVNVPPQATNAGVVATPIPSTNGSFYADEARNMIYFQLDVDSMAPGECLVLSPRGNTESKKYSAGSPSSNELSASVPSGGLNNFYFDSNQQVPATVPNMFNQFYHIHLGETRHFVFKSGGGSPETAPILQRFAINSCGEAGFNYAGSPHGNWKRSELPNLKAASSHVGAVPSRHWSTETRMQRMDESSSEAHGAYSGPVGTFMVRKPIIADFNIRPSVIHRSNFDTAHEQWYWTFGAYMEVRSEQKPLNDSAFKGAFVNGKAMGSPFGYPSDYQSVKSYAMFDLPRKDTPLFSLASFQHAQLGYLGWQPTYMVGNSLCEPRCGSGAEDREPSRPYLYRDITLHQAHYNLGYGGGSTYKNAWDRSLDNDRQANGNWNDLVQNANASTGNMREILYYDASYMVNHALWDRYFLSSLPHDNSGSAIWNNNTTSLPNTRMTLSPYNEISATGRTELITNGKGLDYMAYVLMNQGAFNINSTSVEAWRAFFSTLNDVKRPTGNNQTVTAAFSRMLVPPANDPKGDHLTASPWTSARQLTDAEIDTLANEMVRIVRTRGPFLGVADFVNRRLLRVKGKVQGSLLAHDQEGNFKSDASLCGPLQAAIEKAGVNSLLQSNSIKSPALGAMSVAGGDWLTADSRRGGWSFDNRALNPDFWAFAPWKTFGAPGYLTQADVLQTVGANVTARGDTFVVRGYGEARSDSGKVTARAWCEAVVQRTPDYLVGKRVQDPSDATGNNPLEPAVIRSTADYSLTTNPALLEINKKYGRRFVVRNFRWLNPSEV